MTAGENDKPVADGDEQLGLFGSESVEPVGVSKQAEPEDDSGVESAEASALLCTSSPLVPTADSGSDDLLADSGSDDLSADDDEQVGLFGSESVEPVGVSKQAEPEDDSGVDSAEASVSPCASSEMAGSASATEVRSAEASVSPCAASPPVPTADIGPDDLLADIGPDDLLADIVGQPEATAKLRAALQTPVPAYLFLGPTGAGMREAACRFAGELLALGSNQPATQRRLALAEQHPDLVIFDRVGPSFSAEQARTAVRLAATAPIEADRKVLVVCDLHLAFTTASILLKVVEEPSPTTVFILLAEQIPPHLQTLSSRSVQIDFTPLDTEALREILRSKGVSDDRLELVVQACAGSIERVSLLVSDDTVLERIKLWQAALERLDGSGARSATVTDELLAAIDAAAEPLKDKHSDERSEQKARTEQYSLPTGTGLASTEARHKRELRRQTVDELLMGFAVLTEQIRRRATEHGYDAPGTAARLKAVHVAQDVIQRSANTRLALQHLMLQVGP